MEKRELFEKCFIKATETIKALTKEVVVNCTCGLFVIMHQSRSFFEVNGPTAVAQTMKKEK